MSYEAPESYRKRNDSGRSNDCVEHRFEHGLGNPIASQDREAVPVR